MSEELDGPDIPILYRDEGFVVVNKPPELLVHHNPKWKDRENLNDLVSAQLERRAFAVHRLDRAASGAIILAFDGSLTRALQANLQSESAVKEYLALVRGETEIEGEIDRPLTDRKTGKRKEAFTSFRRLALFSRCSLLAVRIRTGRHRQIRRHFDGMAHQLIGCTHHGKGRINQFFRETYGLPRLFLHARLLEFEHPTNGERLRVEAPLSGDLRDFLARLPDLPEGLIDSL